MTRIVTIGVKNKLILKYFKMIPDMNTEIQLNNKYTLSDFDQVNTFLLPSCYLDVYPRSFPLY